MQFKRRVRKDAAIEIASLVDIVFLLLLFFVVTTTFRQSPGLDLDLPETRDSAGVELKDIVISIAASEDAATVALGDEEVSLEDLPGLLAAELAGRQPGERTVVVQADRAVRFEAVFEVLDIVRSSGATGITVPAILRAEEQEGQ